jgi:hypothetical protein
MLVIFDLSISAQPLFMHPAKTQSENFCCLHRFNATLSRDFCIAVFLFNAQGIHRLMFTSEQTQAIILLDYLAIKIDALCKHTVI